MKNIKKLSLVAAAVCAVVALGCVASACSEEEVTDYSTYTYADYAKEDWDAKTISYQMYNDTDSPITGPMGVKADYLLNLYSDGSAALFQAGLWDSTGMDANWYDQDNYIAYAFFGMWTEADGVINVRMVGEAADSSLTVDMDCDVEEWIVVTPDDRDNEDLMGQTIALQFKSEDSYKFNTDSYYYIPMGTVDKFMGAIMQSEEGEENADSSELYLTTTVKYNSISEWVADFTENGTATFDPASSGQGM